MPSKLKGKKMTGLTKAEASARTKEGWKKRKRAKPEPISSDEGLTQKQKNAIKKTAAGGTVAFGSRPAYNLRNRIKYQHEWKRAATGETIQLRGFKGKSFEQMKGAADAVENQVKPDIKLAGRNNEGLVITNKRPRLSQIGTAGTHSVKSDAPERLEVARRIASKIDGTPNGESSMQTLQRVRSAMKIHPTNPNRPNKIELNEITMNEGLLNKTLVKLGLLSSQGQGIAAHELGHAVDFSNDVTVNSLKNPSGNSFAKAGGWKAPKGNFGIDSLGDIKYLGEEAIDDYGFVIPSAKKARGYQRTEIVEDFAETFATSLNQPREVPGHKNTPVHKALSSLLKFAEVEQELAEKGIDFKNHFNPVVDAPRTQWMKQNVLRESPSKQGANIVEKRGVHQHADKFIVAAGVAGATAYGIHKYKTDDEFRGKVDKVKNKFTR